MDIEQIKKYIQQYTHRDRSKLYITPYRTWIGILVFTGVSLVGASMFGYYAFMHYYVRGVEVVSSEKTTEEQLSDIEILKKDLDEVLLYFENKEKKHQELLAEKNSFESVVAKEQEEETVVEASSSEETIDTTEQGEDVSVLDLFKQNMSSSASVFKPLVDLFR